MNWLPFAAVLLLASQAPVLVKVDSAWSGAVAARDEHGFLSRVARDSVFASGTLQVGREAIREKWSRYFAPEGPALRWKPTDWGKAASGDLGWTIGDAFTSWKEKGVSSSPGRYVTVWAKDHRGRWMAVLDSPLVPAPRAPSARKALHSLASRDGRLEASIGTWERGEGAARTTGTFLVVKERRGGEWHALVDSEVAAPPAR